MTYFMPFLAFLFGLFGFAYANAGMVQAPPPPSTYPANGGYEVPVQTCPEVTAQCEFGYMYDNSGCATNECAPDPAIQQREWDAQCVKDQQRSLADFNRYNIKEGERRIKELTRNNMVIPENVRELMEQMKAGYTRAQGLTECRDLGDATQDLYQISNDFNDTIRDAEDAMFNVRCIKDTQRELKDFERYTIKDAEAKLAKAAKKKIAVPAVLVEGLPRLKQLLAEARKGTTCNDINDAKNEMHSFNEELQEAAMQLDFLMRGPEILQQITREIKNIERQWKTAANRAKRSKADLSDLVARGQGLIDQIKTLFEEFKAALLSGDFERIREAIEQGDAGAREHEDEIFEIIRTIEALSNAPRYIKELDRRVKDMRRQAKDMQRFDKIDTSALTACLDTVKPLIDTVREEMSRRPADPDAMMDASAAVEEALSDCEEIRHSLEGTREEFFGEFVPDQIFKNGREAGPQPPPIPAVLPAQ